MRFMREKIRIGKITGPVGLKGEVKVMSYSGDPERFSHLEKIYLKDTEYVIERASKRNRLTILKLEGVNDRNEAEKLRNLYVDMAEEDLEPLEEGSFYIRDLIGLDVLDSETGEKLGTLKDVLTDRPQDIFVVKTEVGKDVMIPGVSEFVKEIKPEEGCITVALIKGLMEL